MCSAVDVKLPSFQDLLAKRKFGKTFGKSNATTVGNATSLGNGTSTRNSTVTAPSTIQTGATVNSASGSAVSGAWSAAPGVNVQASVAVLLVATGIGLGMIL